MTEMTITIPLSALSGVESLTPQGIINALSNNERLVEENKNLQTRVEGFQQLIRDYAGTLEQIIDADMSPFDKAQSFRKLSTDVKALVR